MDIIKSTTLRKIAYVNLFFFAIFFQSKICLGSTATKPAIVYMYDKYFEPATITISAGQKVIWINKGKLDHTVTSNNGYFDSGHIRPGEKVSYSFPKPGTYSYKCTLHTFMSFGMKGTVIVK
jgi:plastocyanin